MKKKLEIYCVTDKDLKFFDRLKCNLAAVGKNKFPDKYIRCNKGKNIFYKEEFYSELTFHYWFWQNELKKNINKNDIWIGFCQKRRFWLQSEKNALVKKNNKYNFLNNVPKKWDNYDAIICKKMILNQPKVMKLIKRGWKNILSDPSIFYDKKKHNIKLHFDMFHGYGNIDLAISVMNKKDQDEFRTYINSSNEFNPHIMFITKPKIMNQWFEDLFGWLKRCEKIFGFNKLKGYDTKRLYAYLAERYLSFWFKKYSNYLEWPYVFIDTEKLG